MPLNCGGYLEDTLVDRKMSQMFSYRKSSCLHGPRHGVNIQCTMTAWLCMRYETWIWAQICAPPDQLQERHVRPFLTTALWSQLQAASEAPFALFLTFMTFIFGPCFLYSAAKWSLEWNGMKVLFDDNPLAELWSKNTPVESCWPIEIYWNNHPYIILWFGLGLPWMLRCHVQADEKHLQWQKESRDNESCLLVVWCMQIVLILLQGMDSHSPPSATESMFYTATMFLSFSIISIDCLYRLPSLKRTDGRWWWPSTQPKAWCDWGRSRIPSRIWT